MEDYILGVEQGRVRALSLRMSSCRNRAGKAQHIVRIVAEEFAPYQNDGSDPRVHAEGPPCLPADKAQSGIALVVHELATNAAKYGGLGSGRPG
jgi:two-component sensor histidine kinase